VAPRNATYLCVHSHFEQPPRGNPVTGDIGQEASAAPYRNWNERIVDDSYRPNAAMGNFEHISFDVGEILMNWLQRRAPETYRRILQSNQAHQERHKVGNAIGGPMHHVILPLSRLRDKRTQLNWGRLAFQHHFGRDPIGLWLPELAVDMETLRAAQEAGYQYTIVSQGQVEGGTDSAGPFWVDLENGQKIAVFVRNDELSNDLSFNIANYGGAGHWARNRLSSRRAHPGALMLIAAGGETFGHHHIGEEKFLHWLLEHEAGAMGYKVITLNDYLQETPPTDTVKLKMFSSWSCYHGVARWATGCACTPGDSTWKGALRRALDNLSGDLDELYQDVMKAHGVNPWIVRDGYANVWLGDMEGAAYLSQYIDNLSSEDSERILALLKAQVQIMQAYTSGTFYYEDFDRPEPRYAIACAAYAIYLARSATGDDLGRRFRNELYMAHSGRSPLSGSQVFDEIQAEYGFSDQPKVAVET